MFLDQIVMLGDFNDFKLGTLQFLFQNRGSSILNVKVMFYLVLFRFSLCESAFATLWVRTKRSKSFRYFFSLVLEESTSVDAVDLL